MVFPSPKPMINLFLCDLMQRGLVSNLYNEYQAKIKISVCVIFGHKKSEHFITKMFKYDKNIPSHNYLKESCFKNIFNAKKIPKIRMF